VLCVGTRVLISCYVFMLTRLSVRALSCAVVLAAGLLSSAAARDRLDWVSYFNERFVFSFRYPAGVFAPERRSERGDGEVFVAAGGEARLLVGAFENTATATRSRVT